jgi:vanillate O-demethylase monooxygenase subunit
MGKLLPGDRVQCPYHGLEFAADGKCVHNPHGTGAIPKAAHLRAYPVVERHKMIWIWMGTKPPTPDTIPDYSCLDKAPAEHITDPGYLRMDASLELIVNNLLDLTHTTYLHAGILGNDETVHAKITVESDENSVTVSRPIRNVTAPGLFLKMQNWPEKVGDHWQTIRWMPPSVLILTVGMSPAGKPIEAGTGIYALHLLAPETDTSTHYYFSAVRWNVMTDASVNEEIRQFIGKTRQFAFAEQDGPMIEAQQARMNLLGEAAEHPVLLNIDAGPVQYGRILDRLLREDG